jgi:hypothetical protein
LLEVSHPDVVLGYLELGRAHLALGERAAVPALERALTAFESRGDAAETAKVRFSLAQALWLAGEHARAKAQAALAARALDSKLHRVAHSEVASWLEQRQ